MCHEETSTKAKTLRRGKERQRNLGCSSFSTKRLVTKKFTEFVINDFIASLVESDKKYIVENQDPMDYYFSICLYLRNHYIANFTSRGYKIIGDDGRACQGDHFRENYSVTIMYKIIKKICKEANVDMEGHNPFGFYEAD